MKWAILEGEHERASFDQILGADGFLLGRKVYEGFASYWSTAKDDTARFADRVNEIPKYVASGTLEEPLDWDNSALIKGDLADEVFFSDVTLLSYRPAPNQPARLTT